MSPLPDEIVEMYPVQEAPLADPLTDLLATALRTDHENRCDSGPHEATFQSEMERIEREEATRLAAVIPPDQADAMRAGLLWVEVESLGWAINRAGLIHVPYRRERLWQVVASRERMSISGEGPTLLAALTVLRARLRGEG